MAITIDKAYLKSVSDEAYAIDEQLAQSGSPTAGKRALINKMVAENTADVSAIVTHIGELPNVTDQIAVFNKIVKAVNDAYGTAFDTYLDSVVDSQPKVEIAEAERTKMVTRRKELKANWDSLVAVWPIVHGDPSDPDKDISDIPAPKKMTGVVGLRGPRPMTDFVYAINGTKLPADENKLKLIAEKSGGTKTDKEGKSVSWIASDLRNFIVQTYKTQGIDFDVKNPPDTFTVTLPNGSVLSATKLDEPAEDDDADQD